MNQLQFLLKLLRNRIWPFVLPQLARVFYKILKIVILTEWNQAGSRHHYECFMEHWSMIVTTNKKKYGRKGEKHVEANTKRSQSLQRKKHNRRQPAIEKIGQNFPSGHRSDALWSGIIVNLKRTFVILSNTNRIQLKNKRISFFLISYSNMLNEI